MKYTPAQRRKIAREIADTLDNEPLIDQDVKKLRELSHKSKPIPRIPKSIRP